MEDKKIAELVVLFNNLWMMCGNFKKSAYRECAGDFFYDEGMSFNEEIFEEALFKHSEEIGKMRVEAKNASKV